MTTVITDKIEILSVDVLNDDRPLVSELHDVSHDLRISLGWHYLLDLAWTAKALGSPRGLRILDAGAGRGVIQWWLAMHRADVISVDRGDRSHIERRFRAWCNVKGLRPRDLRPLWRPGIKAFLPPRNPRRLYIWPYQVGTTLVEMMAGNPVPGEDRGSVMIYHQDLASLRDIPSESVDVIVSISALEHNDTGKLKTIVQELLRVLKPGGRLIATLGAAKNRDWFHEPSKGWCYTDTTLRKVFELDSNCPSNFNRHDELFESLRGCSELRDNLARFYFRSGDNGMPWGKWNPEYQPVGIVKVKTA